MELISGHRYKIKQEETATQLAAECYIDILSAEERVCDWGTQHKGEKGTYFSWANAWRGAGCGYIGFGGAGWMFNGETKNWEFLKDCGPIPKAPPMPCLKGNPGYDLMM